MCIQAQRVAQKREKESKELSKEYPAFDGSKYPEDWVTVNYHEDLKMKDTHVAHYFEIDDEPAFMIGKITHVAPSYNHCWVLFQNEVAETKCLLPESGYERFWYFIVDKATFEECAASSASSASLPPAPGHDELPMTPGDQE